MTKKERELYVYGVGLLRSAKALLEYDMKDYDCYWPKPILSKLDKALNYFNKMRPKEK